MMDFSSGFSVFTSGVEQSREQRSERNNIFIRFIRHIYYYSSMKCGLK